MAKDTPLNTILVNYKKATEMRAALDSDIPKGVATKAYHRHRAEQLDRNVEYWKNLFENFGRTKAVRVTGEIEHRLNKEVSVKKRFELVMVGPSKEEVLVYMKAQAETTFKEVLFETIQLYEFQTGRLITN